MLSEMAGKVQFTLRSQKRKSHQGRAQLLWASIKGLQVMDPHFQRCSILNSKWWFKNFSRKELQIPRIKTTRTQTLRILRTQLIRSLSKKLQTYNQITQIKFRLWTIRTISFCQLDKRELVKSKWVLKNFQLLFLPERMVEP